MSEAAPGPRRSTHTDMPIAYGAIGASAAPDLLRFPPAESTPYEEEVQLGSGPERFLTAANLLMTWGAQRVAGVEVLDIESGEPGDYSGVTFTEDGTPEINTPPEELFTPEGEPYLQPGSTATFKIDGGVSRRIMVVSTTIEPRKLGFSWGDCEEVPGFGEQQLLVEHRSDGTVWAIARGFAFIKPPGVLGGLKQRSIHRDVLALAQSFLDALLPGAAIRTGTVVPAETDETPAIEEPRNTSQPSDEPADAGNDAADSVDVSPED